MKSLVIIPARMDSRRFPGKPLHKINGRSLIDYVYQEATLIPDSRVLVTSPDREVIEHCRSKGIGWYPSSRGFANGTQRCEDIQRRLNQEFDVVVNWQCDEVEVSHVDVERAIDVLRGEPDEGRSVSTLYHEAQDDDFLTNPSRTKVRLSGRRVPRCIDFTRQWIPGAREHIGVYVFTWSTLQNFGDLPPSDLANLESLEQLTWIEHGATIYGAEVHGRCISINTPEDADEFERRRVAG